MKNRWTCPALIAALTCCTASLGTAVEPAHTPTEVKAVMKKTADWQIEHLRDDYGREHRWDSGYSSWTYAALYIGMVKWAALADDPAYTEMLKSMGDELDWDLGRSKYHADHQAVGQLYLELYRVYGDPEMMAKTQTRTEWIRNNPSEQTIEFSRNRRKERWSWCDALFMAPPVWAKLSAITGDPSYRDFMFAEYQATTDHLFDPEESLYFRDDTYIEERENGKKIFWSRGNGWVFAGLPLIIDELPEGEQKDYFIDLYLKMAATLARLQTPEGHWAMSLLSADLYPTPETSGTGFYTYGLAWGINHGLLDRAEYEPVVMKGWDALVSHITDDGMLGYVQPVGAGPGEAWPDRSEVYGTGAFLAAGSEVWRLMQGE